MRIINREKALGLSLLSFLKVPVILVVISCLLLSGCGSEPQSVNSAASPSAAAATSSTTTADPADTAFAADPADLADPAATASPTDSANPAVVADAKSSNDVQLKTDEKTGKEAKVAKAPANGTKGIIPSKIEIPSLKIKADVIALGLTKTGAMDVPKNDNDVAWFAPGYRPGTPGHAVLAGHVDSKTGPAVFYKLGKLNTGDKIILTDKKNKKLTFKVISKAKYPYNDAPLEEIFGPSDSPLLNVITCTGKYSRSKGTHQERLVVTAELIS